MEKIVEILEKYGKIIISDPDRVIRSFDKRTAFLIDISHQWTFLSSKIQKWRIKMAEFNSRENWCILSPKRNLNFEGISYRWQHAIAEESFLIAQFSKLYVHQERCMTTNQT